MNISLHSTDISVFSAYVLGLLAIALWISRSEKKEGANTEDYYLASKALYAAVFLLKHFAPIIIYNLLFYL